VQPDYVTLEKVMIEYLLRYGLFLAQTLTFVLAIAVVLSLIVSAAMRTRERQRDRLVIRKINDRFDDMRDALKSSMLDDKAYKQFRKEQQKKEKEEQKALNVKRKEGEAAHKPRLFVLNFDGGMDAHEVEHLREEITAVLTVAQPSDEVVLKLESPGGVVHGYGLCASQLQRLRDHSIPLTVLIDKVAASGGYLMACVANRIVAAPFAIIGSIGVLMQIPNFNKLLRKHDIDYEMITAGEYKRTLTLFGENSDKARKKAQEEVNDIHGLFKRFVSTLRPVVNIDDVATGEFWYGEKALALNLVDELKTSDDFLLEKSKDHDLYEVSHHSKPTLREKLSESAAQVIDKSWKRILHTDSTPWFK
jgi:serine protease SohB